MVAAAREEIAVRVKLRAGNWDAYNSTAREMLVEGPARTGKTFALLLRMVKHAHEDGSYRGLIVRKVAATLSSTILRTLEEDVLHGWDTSARASVLDHVHYFGGSQHEPNAYVFDNGARIVVGGMDQATKVLGSEYDEIYFNEVIEGTVEDVETLMSRLSRGEHPAFFGDCNPSSDRHWALARARKGQMQRIKTYLRDNPAFYDDDGVPTARGEAYLESMAGLTGSRYQRLVLGEWVGMENAIYDTLDRDKHLIPLPDGTPMYDAGQGIDYGTVHISASVVVTKASDGRIWVRECQIGGEEEQPLLDWAHSFKTRYRAYKGVVDPIPAMQMLAAKLGFKRSGHAIEGAKGGEGSRVANIFRVKQLIADDALRFDINGEGVRDLFDECLDYRWLHKDTENIEKYIVDRHNEDRVAAMEYAIEALETVTAPDTPRSGQWFTPPKAGPRQPSRHRQGMVYGGARRG